MKLERRFFAAVTGAQGVGKSTFCKSLTKAISAHRGQKVTLLEGIGQDIRERGLSVGSASTSQTIPNFFSAHLARETNAPDGIIILDRCLIDAVAYAKELRVSSANELMLYNEILKFAAPKIGLVIHLELSDFFVSRGKDHETKDLRLRVAGTISSLISELRRPCIRIDASQANSVDIAMEALDLNLDKSLN